MAADVSEMYADNPVSWDAVLAQVDACLKDDDDMEIGELTDNDIAHFLTEELQSQHARDRVLDPEAFSQEICTIAMALVKAMVLGSVQLVIWHVNYLMHQRVTLFLSCDCWEAGQS